jgi:hypothetical protein
LQETVAGLPPFQKAGLDPREQLDAFFDEYLRTIVPPVAGRLASLSVRDAVGVGGGACSVSLRNSSGLGRLTASSRLLMI